LVCDTSTETVIAASENCPLLFLLPLESIIGAKISDLLSFADLSNFSVRDALDQSKAVFHNLITKKSARPVTQNYFHTDKFAIIDLEPLTAAEKNSSAFIDHIRHLVHRVDLESEIEPMLARSVEQIKNLTGLDRVMIYRFDPNADGYVVAEAVTEGLESFLELHYPASDIPAQARKLYFNSNYRMIVDVDSAAVSIQTNGELNRGNLDLSESNLRAVSPFHIQYLKNMGVRSSFSLPLKVNGKLWGLIACHHYSDAKHLSRDIRSSCELAAQIIAGRISDQISERRLGVHNNILAFSQSLLSSVADGNTAAEAFRAHRNNLLDIGESAGAYVRIGAEEMLIGETPSLSHVKKILAKLSAIDSLGLVESREIAVDFSLPYEESAVGMLAVPLSFAFEDLIIWFRPEFIQEIRWGGNPYQKAGAVDLMRPRASFNSWLEQVKGKSREWGEASQEAAQYILYTFVRGIFQKASELSKANKELALATQAKDDFIGMISHELRTPLGVVLGWADILRDGIRNDSNLKQGLDIIHRNAKLQINLINDLLDNSRIISGKMRVNLEREIDIAAIINEVVRDLEATVRIKSIQVQCNLENIIASSDPERLRQIVWNLLSNAIKFTPKNGIIRVSLIRRGPSYQLIVEDSGVGIQKEQLSRIFERFAQARETHAAMGGLGLGLSIVKTLVELLGGRIVANSNGKDQGSTFIASLPIFDLHESGEQQTIQQIETAALPDRSELKRSSKEIEGLSVLIVEDDAITAHALDYLFTKMGARTAVVHNADTALSSLSSQQFDVLVSDIGMPDTDGLELIRSWRQVERERGSAPLPAIALTGRTFDADIIDCLKAGFQNHVAKPVDWDELVAAISTLGIQKKN
ncbi:MAG: Multi-sensor Signal Transduction Histidine Kinase, partial [Verrucomicrobiaceae bacterium]|nr:Multi-sensor Signal Transduction Histidine Kinase [Verrucomicrobiaceae bacterium]